MKIRILGSAAGGGFPQWNCNCRNCAGVRDGSIRTQRRTQSSIAISGDGEGWALINASPDILHQLQATPALRPSCALRDSRIAAVILTDAQIDHVTGLFMLRESTAALSVWCTASAYLDLTNGNPVVRVLSHYCGVKHRIIVPRRAFSIEALPTIVITPVALTSKAAPYSPHREAPHDDDNIALHIVDTKTGGSLFYAPGLGAMSEATWQSLCTTDCALVDGTFWTDDELIRLGISKKFARDIGHLPLSGPDGMIDWLGRLPGSTRKVLVHINNTNPILDESSAERALLAHRGIEVAYDGMEIDA